MTKVPTAIIYGYLTGGTVRHAMRADAGWGLCMRTVNKVIRNLDDKTPWRWPRRTAYRNRRWRDVPVCLACQHKLAILREAGAVLE